VLGACGRVLEEPSELCRLAPEAAEVQEAPAAPVQRVLGAAELDEPEFMIRAEQLELHVAEERARHVLFVPLGGAHRGAFFLVLDEVFLAPGEGFLVGLLLELAVELADFVLGELARGDVGCGGGQFVLEAGLDVVGQVALKLHAQEVAGDLRHVAGQRLGEGGLHDGLGLGGRRGHGEAALNLARDGSRPLLLHHLAKVGALLRRKVVHPPPLPANQEWRGREVEDEGDCECQGQERGGPSPAEKVAERRRGGRARLGRHTLPPAPPLGHTGTCVHPRPPSSLFTLTLTLTFPLPSWP